nr:nucleic acid-binding, OB-fold protein [Tanacetum cinerariifolium]
GDSRRFTVWNEMAIDFDIQTYVAMKKAVTIAVGSCYAKNYGGTPTTYYYINQYIQEVHQILR